MVSATGVFRCHECTEVVFQGLRYKCVVCSRCILCATCFREGEHNERHEFFTIHPPAMRLQLVATSPPVLPSAEPAPAPPPQNPSSSASAAISSHSFYLKSLDELKSYLRQNEVDYSDIADQDWEKLSFRAWSTRVQHMTIPEINTFLADNDIPTSNCIDLAQRRRMVENTFDPTRIRVPQENDVVVLRGEDMKGKAAKVLQPDCGDGGVLVSVKLTVEEMLRIWPAGSSLYLD